MRWKITTVKSVALISITLLVFACGGGSGDSGGGSTPTVAFTLSWNAQGRGRRRLNGSVRL